MREIFAFGSAPIAGFSAALDARQVRRKLRRFIVHNIVLGIAVPFAVRLSHTTVMLHFVGFVHAVVLPATALAGLVGFYTLEGNANDICGNANHGTLVSTSTLAAGYQGQAYDLDAHIITLPINIDTAAMPQFTIGAWVNVDVITGLRRILSHDNGEFDRTLNLDYGAAVLLPSAPRRSQGPGACWRDHRPCSLGRCSSQFGTAKAQAASLSM